MTPSAHTVPAHESAVPLNDIQARAQAEAQRLFGDGPVAAWDAPAPAAAGALAWRRRGRVAAALLLVAAAGLAGVASMAEHAEPAPHVADAVPASLETDPEVDAGEALPNAGPGTVVDARPLQQQLAAAAPALVVDRRMGLWSIDAVNASRLDAAQQLARLSGVPLPPAAALLATTTPLELHWRGRDLAGAWQAVIGPELNFALHCRVQQCRLWILGREQAATVPAARSPDHETDTPATPVDDGVAADTAPVTPPPVDELHHG